jgi:hypothetical protein
MQFKFFFYMLKTDIARTQPLLPNAQRLNTTLSGWGPGEDAQGGSGGGGGLGSHKDTRQLDPTLQMNSYSSKPYTGCMHRPISPWMQKFTPFDRLGLTSGQLDDINPLQPGMMHGSISI